MPYAQQQIYMTWGGTLPSTTSVTGPEIWQCGVRFSSLGGLGSAVGGFNAFSLSDCANIIKTFHSSATVYIAGDVRLDWVKAALLRTDGEYAVQPRVHGFVPGIVGGGGSGFLQPLQASIAVTLWSGETLGRANYGRFYLPTPSLPRGYGLASIGDTNAQNIADAARTMLQQLDGEVSTVDWDWQLSIMSSVGTGDAKPVKEVRVGNVVDTQRRRRNAVTEKYFVAPYTQQGA